MTYGTLADENQGPAHDLWQEGNYTGTFKRHTEAASGVQGTPGIQVYFDVQGSEKVVEMWLTENTLAGMTGDQLRTLGWNGEYPGAEFNPPESVELWMKHDTYKNKTRERWNISAPKKSATPQAVQSLKRAFDVWKAKGAAQAPAPSARPKAPPRPSANGAPPPKAATKPNQAPPKKSRASTEDEAWAWWCKAGREEDSTEFWESVERVAPGKGGKELTASEWDAVAAESGLPF